MSSTNADSMTNAQGEFKPSVPRSEPLTTKGHQVGRLVGNDAAPEFHAQILPAGSAPAKNTYKPNPINETPGQANNPDADSAETTTAANSFPGATSKDVHMGIGKPESNQTSAEAHHEGKTHRARDTTGLAGTGAEGGSGLTGEPNAEAKALQSDHTATGPAASREHNTNVPGAAEKI